VIDPSIVAAAIGASATILAVVLAWWLSIRRISSRSVPSKTKPLKPDEDDIYFMSFLLHDAYEQQTPLSSSELAVHHMDYAPLEVEVKLIRLEAAGYIQRCNPKGSGMGRWQIQPKGVEFMFKNGHYLKELVAEQKNSA